MTISTPQECLLISFPLSSLACQVDDLVALILLVTVLYAMCENVLPIPVQYNLDYQISIIQTLDYPNRAGMSIRLIRKLEK